MSRLLAELRDGIVILSLNEAARRNVLSEPLCLALSEALAEAAANPDARAIIITGAPPAFCAGADLADLEAAATGNMGPVTAVYHSFMDVAMSPLPTLAAVNGPAVGAGFNLALACDMRIASEKARFETRFLKLGLHPGGGHAWMLLRAVAWSHACRLLLAGQSLDAQEAYRIGLIETIVPAGALIDRAVELLRACTTGSRELVLRTKASMRLAQGSDHHSAFLHETAEQTWSLAQPGFAAAIAHFRQR
jgi:enoyl-CoA hydratase